MATALERRQQGEQFRVMDAPNLPDAPKSPNRLVFAGGGFAAGLFMGLLITGLLEYPRYFIAQRKGCMGVHQAAYSGHHLEH